VYLECYEFINFGRYDGDVIMAALTDDRLGRADIIQFALSFLNCGFITVSELFRAGLCIDSSIVDERRLL
jgi:hypothetical protein